MSPTDFPFGSANPIPQSYDLTNTLKLLGLSKQLFYQSGLPSALTSYPVSRMTLFDATSVQEWAKRLGRLRIMQALGERSVRTPLVEAPAEASRDAQCPRCGKFALLTADKTATRCMAGHTTPNPRKR
jgi:hypothetical protein